MAKDYVDRAREDLLASLVDEATCRIDTAASKTESPIEMAFFYALVDAAIAECLDVEDHGLIRSPLPTGRSYSVRFEDGRPRSCVHEATGSTFRHPDPGWPGIPLRSESCGQLLSIWPQCHVGEYRVDFLLELGRFQPAYMVVECDGHDFHDKTKEQARRDKRRDRAIQAAGLSVFRFTGSEIYADAAACAHQCIEYLFDLNLRQIRASGHVPKPGAPADRGSL